MFRTFSLILSVVFLGLIHEESFCQVQKVSDSEPIEVKNAVTLYYRSLGEQSGIYNGPAYIGYAYPLSNGHPFFESPDLSKGTILYEGMLYQDIPFRFDLVKGQVVVQYIDGFSEISLHNERIEHFSLFDHEFIRFEKDSSNSAGMPSGFYDRVYRGKTEVLVRRYKGTLEDVTSEGIFSKILKQKNDIYLKKDGEYLSVASSGSVLKALGSKQKEILSHLKKNKIKFKKDPEIAIVMMVRFYDQSIN